MTPLRSRNYRLYFFGQVVSVPGTWLQTVAQAWLVLQLSASGTALGFTVALQALPVLLLGPWGGAIADAVDKRRLLVGTQAAQAGLAIVLGLLTITGAVQLWMVWILAAGLGVARAVDTPTRQAFISELVEGEALPRAISINSTVAAAARLVGPAAGGTIIAAVGVGACFLVNGASFVAVLVALMLMDRSALLRSGRPAGREPGAVRAGVRYVRGHRDLLVVLLMMALVGTLAYEFQVTIPLLAHGTFGLGASGFGFLYASMGAGAVLAGLLVAGRVAPRIRTITAAALVFAVGLGAAAISPSPITAGLCLALAGAASVIYSSSSNATLQIRTHPAMRGRVLALYVVAFLGSTPLGGPLVGAIGETIGPRAALGAGAAGCLAAAALGLALSPAPRAPRAGLGRSGTGTAPARGPAG